MPRPKKNANPANELPMDEKVSRVKTLVLKGKKYDDVLKIATEKWGWKPEGLRKLVSLAKAEIREDIQNGKREAEAVLAGQRQLILRECFERGDLRGAFRTMQDIARTEGIYSLAAGKAVEKDRYESPEQVAAFLAEQAIMLAHIADAMAKRKAAAEAEKAATSTTTAEPANSTV